MNERLEIIHRKSIRFRIKNHLRKLPKFKQAFATRDVNSPHLINSPSISLTCECVCNGNSQALDLNFDKLKFPKNSIFSVKLNPKRMVKVKIFGWVRNSYPMRLTLEIRKLVVYVRRKNIEYLRMLRCPRLHTPLSMIHFQMINIMKQIIIDIVTNNLHCFYS